MEEHLPPRWKERVLWGINAVPSPEALRFLEAMQRAEGGSAKWNPLNSTYKLSGYTSGTDYNTTGVRNYLTQIGGVAATVLTLGQRESDGSLRFGKIVGGLQGAANNSALTAEQITQNAWDQIQHWGTDPSLILQVLADV